MFSIVKKGGGFVKLGEFENNNIIEITVKWNEVRKRK